MDIRAVEQQALGCTKCRLAQTRTQVVWADGNLDSKFLLIGEAPGRNEDLQGRPFVGAAGQLLDRLLGEVGLDRTRVAIANVIKCRPPGNRDPMPDEIEACTPWLQAQLAHMQPDVVVTLGNFATKFIL
ncbi:MAG: uracil-DNA glycosylase, partial [Actinomycetota bacterium]|nr:uracil-DNA glycosylase [Actinomycetota bacterium]